jgi:hypothetical protein
MLARKLEEGVKRPTLAKATSKGWPTLGQRLNQNRLGRLSVWPLDLLFQFPVSWLYYIGVVYKCNVTDNSRQDLLVPTVQYCTDSKEGFIGNSNVS